LLADVGRCERGIHLSEHDDRQCQKLIAGFLSWR
jgi:hypothetical protein